MFQGTIGALLEHILELFLVECEQFASGVTPE